MFLPTANTLWGYAALALANGAALVAWALYNHRRFAGKDRRRRAAAVGDAQLARSFTVAPAQLQQLRRARVAVIHHGDGGEIIGIEPAARSCAAWPEIASGPAARPRPLAATPLRRACPIFGSRIATTPSSGR